MVLSSMIFKAGAFASEQFASKLLQLSHFLTNMSSENLMAPAPKARGPKRKMRSPD